MDKRAFYRDPETARRYEAVRFGTPAGRLTQELELTALRRAFGPEDKVVELACGTGRLLRALRAEGRDVWGVDQSREMLAAGGEGMRDRVAVADAFDALTTKRPYKKAFSPKGAFFEIRKSSGRQFDPKVVKAFILSFSKHPSVWQDRSA